MNLDFSRLNGQSFERLIRTLCFKLIGTPGEVFSSGADGARDFTFDGPITGYQWDGYLVVQAKFKEKLQSPAQDLAWLKKQLENEKKKYQTRKLKVPTYYILATNVSLSGADGKAGARVTKGGASKIREQLASWRALGLKDADVWGADKLSDLLGAHEAIRKTYSAWLTPGDVLEELIDEIKGRNPDFQQVIRRALRTSLRKDQYARLRDAGDVADPQIRTSQIFVDLPLRTSSITNDSGSGTNSVANLAHRSKERFGSREPLDLTVGISADQVKGKNKIVLLGGPGQGKSTASMFAAQLFRAQMLHDWARTNDPQTFQLANEILNRAEKQGVDLAFARRFPVFVSLPRFADTISLARQSHQRIPSLLNHIVIDFSSACDEEIKKSDFRAWLKNYPWLVILDGLDEVPSSGERASVLEAIQDFEGEAFSVEADLILLITTRPQGYNDELARESWEHWELSDLSTSEAIAYGRALGEARYPEDSYRRDELLRALTEATTKPAISRLMVSPLQVTIMHMIVDTGGSIPSARWSLFAEYFDILRKREKAKGGENQKIIERNWTILGPIHQRAGLILQTDSEHSGAAQSYLTEGRFLQLVEGYLAEQGHHAEEISSRSKELVGVALHRLVLLAARDEGKITFDVRSLQEFMAAGALTAGPPEHVLERLGIVAKSSHWRHVFLIAASRCFAEDVLHHLRTAVIAIPRQIELTSPDRLVGAGARLALEMFVDGVGVDHPVSRRVLARHSIEIIEFGGQKLDLRLLMLFEPSTVETVLEYVRRYIESTSMPLSRNAWSLMLALCSDRPSEFSSSLASLLSSTGITGVDLLDILPLPIPAVLGVDQLIVELARHDPLELNLSGFSDTLRREIDSDSIKRLPDVDRVQYSKLATLIEPWSDWNELLCAVNIGGGESGFKLKPRTSDSFRGWLANAAELPTLSKNWAVISWIARFSNSLNPASLAASLREVSSGFGLDVAKRARALMPWQLASFIDLVENEQELSNFANEIELGEFGSASGWTEAQDRWLSSGIAMDDFDNGFERLPFTDHIALVGAPFFGCGYQVSHQTDDRHLVPALIARAVDEKIPLKARRRIMELANFATVGLECELSLTPSLRKFVELAANLKLSLHPTFYFSLESSAWKDDSFAELLAKCAKTIIWVPRRIADVDIQPLLDAICRCSIHRELFVPLCIGVCFSSKPVVEPSRSMLLGVLGGAAEDSPKVQIALHLIAVALGLPTEDKLIEELQSDEDIIIYSSLLAQLSRTEWCARNAASVIPSILMRANVKIGRNKEILYASLGKFLDSRRSGIAERQIWCDKLALPSASFEMLQLG